LSRSFRTEHPALSLRKLTVAGERAMSLAEMEGKILLDAYPDGVVRAYAAAGLLAAVLDELNSGAPREVAIETLKQALLALGDSSS
jgi:hypothetical protein